MIEQVVGVSELISEFLAELSNHFRNVYFSSVAGNHSRLEEKDKAIIILKYFEDKKLEEIAYILDENVNTIKSRLYRSMKKLRSTLSSEMDGKERCLAKK